VKKKIENRKAMYATAERATGAPRHTALRSYIRYTFFAAQKLTHASRGWAIKMQRAQKTKNGMIKNNPKA